RQALLRVGQDFVAIGGRKQRYDAFRSLEREISGFAEPPVSSAIRLQTLFRAETVNRQLKNAFAFGWPAEFVVDQPETSIVQQIDPVRLAFEFELAIAGSGCDREAAIQPMLEETFDDRHGTFRFHAEYRLT